MPSAPRATGVAFLLAQIGAEVSRRFGERVLPLGITASDAACLRIIATAGPLNQRTLAHRLGIVPSRVVTLIDVLEQRGLVERRIGTDRRRRDLALTGSGEVLVGRLRALAREHGADIVGALDEREVDQLAELLTRIAVARGLAPDAPPHPGDPGVAGDPRGPRPVPA